MAEVVSFIIQKGGCGKTTTTVNTASYLAMQGYRVLAIDMDPQGNLTQHFGYDSDTLDLTIKDLFLNTKSFEEVILKRNQFLHIIPNNIETTTIEYTLYKSLTREFLLRDILAPQHQNYDFILIDCPPNLGILSINALVASKEFVMVVSPEFFPMKAIKPLYETYAMVKSKLNHSLRFKGVVMTMCDFRTRHAQEVRNILQKNFPSKLYKSYIRMNVALKEASSLGKSIFEYAPTSAGAFDYQNFVEEFLRDFSPAREKKQHYDRFFHQLKKEEQEKILLKAKANLSQYIQNRLEGEENEPVLREALIIERNKILEQLYPYRLYSTGEDVK
ncbi:MAG: ParA family protein [Calditrichaeota bacterium]|nr:MAG: ParA family protein [Calditrichota bacterium]